jgi:hypothetical protein
MKAGRTPVLESGTIIRADSRSLPEAREMNRAVIRLLVLASVIGWLLAPANRADWPTYRGDVRRGGIAGEPIKPPLSAEWFFTTTHPPAPAWGDPQAKPVEDLLELPRLRFDDAFHVTAAKGKGLLCGVEVIAE